MKILKLNVSKYVIKSPLDGSYFQIVVHEFVVLRSAVIGKCFCQFLLKEKISSLFTYVPK